MFSHEHPSRPSWARRIVVVLGLSIVATSAFGQALSPAHTAPKERHRRSGPNLTAVNVPFPFIQKQINFKLVPLDKAKFNLMASQTAVLPAGFGGKLKAPQPVVFLEYGYKKIGVGGVGWLYETKAIPGMTPEQLTHLVIDTGAFHDNSHRPTAKIIGQTLGGTFITATTADPGVIEAELESLKKIH